MRSFCFAVAVVPLCLVSLFSNGQAQNAHFPPDEVLKSIHPEGIRANMAFLADDLLEGRRTGTPGYMLAAKYVATQFEEMGLKPAGDKGTYFQNIRLRQTTLVPEQTSVVLTRNGQPQALSINKDYTAFGSALYPDTSVNAKLVFVGYGVTAPEFHYDDYASTEVSGKVVAMLVGAPRKFASAPRAYYSDVDVKAANVVAHGGIGYLAIWAGDIANHVPFTSIREAFNQPSMHWLDEKGIPNDVQPQLHGSALLNMEAASQLFEGSPKSLKQALADAQDGQPQGFPLPVSVSIHKVSNNSEVESPNVAAVLPGSDPKLRGQYVAFTAHLDHLGISRPVKGDSIYNGAVDNSSGVAALLEIARALSSSRPPRRSILFLAVTGEEEGLLGSDYYAHQPTVPISKIVADVNMDEIGVLYNFKDIVPFGAEHSSLEAIVKEVARHFGLEVSPDPAPEQGYFIRSDQYSFVKQGLPSVAISAGYQTLDPNLDGKKISDDWEKTRYHQPSDDMSQPLDFDAAVTYTRVALAVGYEIAQHDGVPHWNTGDFFLRFAHQ